MNTAVYRRVSTDKQDNSLDVQERRIADYCAFKGLEIAPNAVFHDADTSGSVPVADRPGGSQLLRHLSNPASGIIHLVVAKIDRLGRDTVNILQTVKLLAEPRPEGYGVTLHIVDLGGDSLNTNNPFSKFIIATLASCAELELARIRERIRETIGHKFGQGELIGTVPFGYDTEPAGKTNPKTGRPTLRLVPNMAEQHWLRLMLQWRKEGLAYQQIAKRLNEQGARTKAGRQRKWQQGNVHKILNSKHTARFAQTPETPETPA